MAQEAFPLHYLVWNNQYQELDRELQSKQVMLGLDVGDGLCVLVVVVTLVNCCFWLLEMSILPS